MSTVRESGTFKGRMAYKTEEWKIAVHLLVSAFFDRLFYDF